MSCDAMRSISWLKKVKVPKTQKQSVILLIMFESGLSLVIFGLHVCTGVVNRVYI